MRERERDGKRDDESQYVCKREGEKKETGIEKERERRKTKEIGRLCSADEFSLFGITHLMGR